MSEWIHWNIQWLPGPEIEPGTPATLVRSSTAVLPSPISTVHIAPTSTLNSLRPRKLPQIFLLTEVNLSFPGAGHGTICRMRNEQVHTIKHMTEPGIEPGTNTTLVRSSTIELPRPISNVNIAPLIWTFWYIN